MSVGRVFKLSGFCQFVNVGQPFPVKFSGDTDQLGADQCTAGDEGPVADISWSGQIWISG